MRIGLPTAEARALKLEAHLPLARLLGDGPKLAWFAEHPLLGTDREQIEAAYGPPDPRSGDIRVPPNELGQVSLDLFERAWPVTMTP